jgi:hypothetical protein
MEAADLGAATCDALDFGDDTAPDKILKRLRGDVPQANEKADKERTGQD